MEVLANGFTLELCSEGFPLSTDSIALAGFAHLKNNATVLDLGAGCGTLGLLLCAEHSTCHVTGVEIDQNAHNMALKNSSTNGITHRLTSICADLKTLPSFIEAGSFSYCISNPPYFTDGPESKTHATARKENLCTMNDLMAAAHWALKYGGDFFLVHRPERLAEIFACATSHKLEPKRLCLLRHRSDGPVSLVLVQCRKGAKPGLIWEEQVLFHTDGTPTDYYKKLYHL